MRRTKFKQIILYLLWDVVYTVPVQEKLDEAAGKSGRHLSQDVASQIELHEALQVLECVCAQVRVRQLEDTSTSPPLFNAIHTSDIVHVRCGRRIEGTWL